MKSAKPKVMHAVAGLPILGHVIAAMRGAGVARIVVVTAPDARRGARLCGARGRGDRHPGASSWARAMPRPARARCSAIFPARWSSRYGDMPLVDGGDVRSLVRRAREAGHGARRVPLAEHAPMAA